MAEFVSVMLDEAVAVVKSAWFLQSPICSVHSSAGPGQERKLLDCKTILSHYTVTPTFTHFSLLDGPTWFRSSSRRIIQFNPKHALLIMAHARFCRD